MNKNPKNKLSIYGIPAGAFALIPALIFALLIAGCATTQTTREPAAPAARAVARALGEKARVNGSTVTLSGGAAIKKLTVPEGVTLDLTGTDASFANSANENASLHASTPAKWGTGGTYTKGGVSQTGGSNIDSTNGTLIAAPKN